MQPTARDAYLETQVLTASPYQLRLMLIEGAQRFLHQTLAHWEGERTVEAMESLIRAREILCELMSSLDPEHSPLASKILPIYSYLFRTLTEAQLERSITKVEHALRVLGEERETWRQVSEKFSGDEELRVPQLHREVLAPSTLHAAHAPARGCSFEA